MQCRRLRRQSSAAPLQSLARLSLRHRGGRVGLGYLWRTLVWPLRSPLLPLGLPISLRDSRGVRRPCPAGRPGVGACAASCRRCRDCEQ